jgi:hypothetical protein
MNSKAGLGWFIVLPALATWLGWGIRGQIGHANGAMIPGALAALVLCLLLDGKRFSPGLVIGLTAICMGFGADETTLQSAGYVMGTNPHMGINLVKGYSGLAVKGGLWALMGGAGLGMALVYYVYSKRDIVIGALLFVAAFFFGTWTINKPKLIYFSYDRREIWGGLLLGAVALLAWLCIRGRTRVPLVVALSAGATGAIGYPIAVTLATLGLHSGSSGPWNWWSLAETTFGAFIGMGLGLGTYLVMDKMPETQDSEHPAPRSPSPLSVGWIVAGALASALVSALYHDARGYPWILLAPILLCAAFYSIKFAWQVGITLVYCATAANLAVFFLGEVKMGSAPVVWTLTAVSTLAVAWLAEAWSAKNSPAAARKAFVFMMWSILALSYIKSFVNRAIVSPPTGAVAAAGGWWRYAAHIWRGGLVVDLAFTVVVLVLTGVAAGLHFNTQTDIWQKPGTRPIEPIA